MAIRNNLDFFSFLIRPTIVRNVYEAGIIKTYALECENVKGSLRIYTNGLSYFYLLHSK